MSRTSGQYRELYLESFEHHEEKSRGLAVLTDFHFFISSKKKDITLEQFCWVKDSTSDDFCIVLDVF